MKSEKKARGKARENTRHVTAWIMAGLLVAGLVPVLPEAPRALAKDTDVVVELGGDDVPSLDSQAINVYDQTAEVDSGFAAREMEPMAGVASFSDVTAQTAHQEDISWLASSGISKGWDMPDGTVQFRPYANVARADMAAFLFRLAKGWGLVEEGWRPAGSASFSDVTTATAHFDEVMWLAESGISKGWDAAGGKKEFRPLANVARADMAAFLHRMAQKAGIGNPTDGGVSFNDVTAATAHAEDITWLSATGISMGWDASGGYEFRPLANVARADMAAFLHRLDGYKNSGGKTPSGPTPELPTSEGVPSVPQGSSTIENTSSQYAIEADVVLNGTGTGSHAKLVLAAPTAAVSFGIQYDEGARAPYTRKTVLMIENVSNNNAGGQRYIWPEYNGKFIETSKGAKAHLMLTIDHDGRGSVFVNGTKVGDFTNTSIASQQIYLRVEGSARKNGDTINAQFFNIKLKSGGVYNSSRHWGTVIGSKQWPDYGNAGVMVTKASGTEVAIAGTIVGFGPNDDWDNRFNNAGNLVQFT